MKAIIFTDLNKRAILWGLGLLSPAIILSWKGMDASFSQLKSVSKTMIIKI